MKNKIINLSITTIIIFILGIILTLITSLLTNFNIINSKTNDLILIFISLILFFVYGFIFGLKEKKRGILNGLLLSLLYLIISYTFKLINPSLNYSSIYILIGRISLLILGNVIGVNISRE